MIRIVYALTIGLALVSSNADVFAAPPTAPNYNAPAVNQPNNQNQNNRPVVLQGREDLPGMGDLTFIVSGNDEVQMIDASRRPIKGRALHLGGNRFLFTFQDCVYEGVMNNGVLAGTGRFTSGAQAGRTWNFATRFAGNL